MFVGLIFVQRTSLLHLLGLEEIFQWTSGHSLKTELLGTDHSLAAFRIAWVAESRERQGSAEESGRVWKESVEQGLTET